MAKLSVVIAAYRMQREVPRTLLSFLPPLQRGIADVDYEIVLVDNGSPDPLDLGSLSSEALQRVRLVRVTPENASLSPVACINAAVKDHARGDWLLICIDGARLASAHLVSRTAEVLARHPDAFTFVASRHLGPKLQMQSVHEGYGQAVEDALLQGCGWQGDLDKLYAISVLAGAHDGRQPLLQNESNAMGMSRGTWERLGGYDEGFTRPGGGLCNLDLFSRCVTRPGALNVLLYGEATFHQFHGGAATSDAGYFNSALAEHLKVAGKPYARPAYHFLADLGERHDRLAINPL